MKKLVFLIFAATIFSCNSETQEATSQELIDNEELKQLYKEDQGDRQSANIDWETVSERDRTRQSRVYELLDSNKVLTSLDYSNAAMIFQHGGDTIASGMAVKMMRKAIELDSTINKWLLAAAIDRDLMRRGVPQIYGTQYYKQGADDPWELYDLDSTKVTDEERMEYGVETLAQQREKLKMMNKKKLWDLLESGKTIEEIVQWIKDENLEESTYNLTESGINSFGYELMRENRNEEALKIFQLNTELYPTGFNTYDSLGECLLKLGKKEEGIKAYKKSLELNPNNDNATKVLSELNEQ